MKLIEQLELSPESTIFVKDGHAPMRLVQGAIQSYSAKEWVSCSNIQILTSDGWELSQTQQMLYEHAQYLFTEWESFSQGLKINFTDLPKQEQARWISVAKASFQEAYLISLDSEYLEEVSSLFEEDEG